MAIEEPSFELIEQSDTFEIRQYAPMIVAEVLVDGDMSSASSKGFRLIAGFIFGKNIKLDQGQVPSISASESASPSASEKIAMTIPVTVEPQSEIQPDFDRAKMWRVQFVMPRQYTMESIPKPTDSSVKLRQIQGKRFAVLKYTGFNGAEKVNEKTQELLDWLKTRNLQPVHSPQLARYNPPWSLPFLRRNEILIEVATSKE